jgi:DNA polymerase-3 subunit alpha
LLQALDQIISVSGAHFKAIQSGQMTFFGSIQGVEEHIVLPMVADVDRREKLEWEKELIGLYVSDHPLSPYLAVMTEAVTHFSAQLKEASPTEKVTVAGMVTKFRTHVTKDGKAMGFATIEDLQGTIELVLFPRSWEAHNEKIRPDTVLLVTGKPDTVSGDPKVLVDKLEEIDLTKPLKKKSGDKKAVKTPAESQEETNSMSKEAPEPDWSQMPPMPDELFDADYRNDTQPAASIAEPRPDWPQTGIDGSTPPINSKANQTADATIGWGSIGIAEKTGTTAEQMESTVNAVVPDDYVPQRITVSLLPTGDKDRDKARLVRVHTILTAHPGKDKFGFLLFENDRRYQMDFPNHNTRVCDEVLTTLKLVVGEENVRIDETIFTGGE